MDENKKVVFDHEKDDLFAACGITSKEMLAFEVELAKIGNSILRDAIERSNGDSLLRIVNSMSIERMYNWVSEDPTRVRNLVIAWFNDQKRGFARDMSEEEHDHNCDDCPGYDMCDLPEKKPRGTSPGIEGQEELT